MSLRQVLVTLALVANAGASSQTGVEPGFTYGVAHALPGPAAGRELVGVRDSDDRDVLQLFYLATGGENWTRADNWLTDAPLDEWYGVTADEDGAVVALDFGTRNGLTGSIPPELGGLPALRELNLSDNQLTGPIPPELGRFPVLRVLNLGDNQLTGPIPPELGGLAALEELNLWENGLTGSIPRELGQLSALRQLDFSGNELTGPIPPELGRLSALERLRLVDNALTEPIPAELGNLALAVTVDLAGNELTGPIPAELGRLAAASWLDLSGNQLAGPIPPELGRLAALRQLNLSDNALTGPIPPELGRLAALRQLDVSDNWLAGPSPASFLDLAQLAGFRWERNAGLCLPATAAFDALLARLEARSGAWCTPDAGAPVPSPLEPHEYDLWEGEWFNTDPDADPDGNVYEILRVADADATGFTYEFECRQYGPDAVSTGEARASFEGPLRAGDGGPLQIFVLGVDPGDPRARAVETNPRWYESLGGPCLGGGRFEFRPAMSAAGPEGPAETTSAGPGFDCELAATPVEETICGNELIALGDREMTDLYRELLAFSSDEDGAALRASQRDWLSDRNGDCLGDEAVDEVCLARLYSDRLVALARARDAGLGSGPRFDAAYASALLSREVDLRQETEARLAMYPQVMAEEGTVSWQADEFGLLFEQTYTAPGTVDDGSAGTISFRYSEMLFVGWDGTVWSAWHTEPVMSLERFGELGPSRVWMGAGRDPFTIRSETGIESTEPPAAGDDVPELVRSWLNRHPIAETMPF